VESKTKQKSLQTLLNAEMDRRQFLGLLGAATLAVVGISGIIKGLDNLAGPQETSDYGGGAYGGQRQPTSRIVR
jgi:hypothetical protein